MISLAPFCGYSSIAKYLAAPWTVGDYTFASNGRIAVRVHRRDDAAVGDGNAVHAAKVISEHIRDCRDAVPKMDIPTAETCSRCKGSGSTLLCIKCNGEGEHPSEFGDCQTCNGVGELACSEHHSMADPCSECAGMRTAWPTTALIRLTKNVFVHPRYFAQLRDLDDLRFDASAVEGAPVPFQFFGGHAVLMPMRAPKAAPAWDRAIYIADAYQHGQAA